MHTNYTNIILLMFTKFKFCFFGGYRGKEKYSKGQLANARQKEYKSATRTKKKIKKRFSENKQAINQVKILKKAQKDKTIKKKPPLLFRLSLLEELKEELKDW